MDCQPHHLQKYIPQGGAHKPSAIYVCIASIIESVLLQANKMAG
jgi:hypothetical protein